MDTRRCHACGDTKPLSEFYNDKSRPGGKEYRCKSCSKSYHLVLVKIWQKEHPEYGKNYMLGMKTEVLSHYSTMSYPICAKCGETDITKLCLDHVNGHGVEHLKSINLFSYKHNVRESGSPFYCWLRRNNYPNDPPLQVLCADCNLIKSLSERKK